MKNVTADLILHILNLLKSESDKLSFATINKNYWKTCSVPTDKQLVLCGSINALRLKKTKNLVIDNRYINYDLLKHIFLYAINLKTILFEKRPKFSFQFLVAFFSLFIKIYKPLILYVPPEAKGKFSMVMEDYEYDFISILPSVPNCEKQLDHMIGQKVLQLFDFHSYKTWEEDSLNNDMMKKNDGLLENEAEELILQYCPKLVESAVLMKENWFLITSFSIFLHKHLNLDDCADRSRTSFQKTLICLIRRKMQMGKEYFELTLRFGLFEVVATSGFFGPIVGSSCNPFLGSSISNLPKAITNSLATVFTETVFIPDKQRDYLKKTRMLNQYYKKHSTRLWRFYSLKFDDKGFKPADPINFYNERNTLQSAASLIINSFAYKKVDKVAIKKTLALIDNIEESTLSSTNKLVKKYVALLCDENHTEFDNSKHAAAKKDLIAIYNNTLAGALKASNIKNIKIAKKIYILSTKLVIRISLLLKYLSSNYRNNVYYILLVKAAFQIFKQDI